MSWSRTLIFLSLCLTVAAPLFAAAASAEALAPREDGARYGQALGVLEVCHGSKLTAKAEALPATYTGTDLEAFKTEAAKIYDAWAAVRGCTKQHDPNQCKIIMDKSCLAAEAEIGADGKAMPGLVEFLKH